jgi:hypothetical protein
MIFTHPAPSPRIVTLVNLLHLLFNKAEICMYIWNYFYTYNIEETHFIPADLTVEQWWGLWGLRGPGNRPPAPRKKTLFFLGYIW